MAKFKPFKVTSSQLKSLPIVEGQLIFVTDTSQTFLDINGTTRTEFNGNQSNTCFDMIFHGYNYQNDGNVYYRVEKEEALKFKEQFVKTGKTSLSVFFGSKNTHEGEYADSSVIFGYGEIKIGDYAPKSLDAETVYSITNGFLLGYETNNIFSCLLGTQNNGVTITFTIDDENGFQFAWPHQDYVLATTKDVQAKKSFFLDTTEPSSAVKGDVWGIVEE